MNKLIDEKALVRRFDRAAKTYDASISLPQEIGLRLLERLDLMRLQPNLIIDLGCATGYLGKHLTKRYRDAKVIGIDFSMKMLGQAQRRKRWLSRQRFINANAYQLPFADQSVDLIFSNLMVAWCENIDTLFLELRRVLKPQGLLLFTTLGPDTLQELKQSWQALDAKHTHVHPFYDMHDIGDSLVKAKFLDPVMDMEKLTLNYTDLNKLFADLKNLGMQNVSHLRNHGLTTPRQWQAMQQQYATQRTSGESLPSTFEVIYGHAWSHDLPTSSTNELGEVVIPITKIKRKHI